MAGSELGGRQALRRSRVVALWPVGMGLAAWRYVWRTTPVHRWEEADSSASADATPLLPGVDDKALQRIEDGVGPIFHRRYRTWICGARRTPSDVVGRIADNPNRAAPKEVARFRKTRGAQGRMEAGDEYLIRMPGPWDGPVRVIDRTATSFQFATLRGHLEAGQIGFRLDREAEHLIFEIDSWARSADRLSYVLYDRVHLAKEMQLHMWTHFSERVARLTGGRMTGGVEILTGRHEGAGDGG